MIGLKKVAGVKKTRKNKPNGSPSGLTATAIDASSVNLTWVNNATNQDGYHVYVSTDHVNFSLLETVTGKGNSRVIGGLTYGNFYDFKVCLYKGEKLSDFSNVIPTTTILDYDSIALFTGTIDYATHKWLDKSCRGNDIIFKNASARTSASGNLDYTITGLLTSDTVEVVTGSDTPTIPTNGTLRISQGQVVYGVTIKRSGSVWATIPFCEPTYNTNLPLTSYDVSGNGHHATCSTLASGNITTQNNYFYLLQHGYNYKKLTYQSNYTSGLDGSTMAWGTGGAGTCTSDGTKLNISVTTQPSSSATSYPRLVRNNTLTIGVKTKITVKGTGLITGYNWGTFVNTPDIDLSLQDWVMEFTPTTTTLYICFNGSARSTFSLDSVLIEQYYIVPAISTTDALGKNVEIVQDGTKWLNYSGDIQLPIVVNNPRLSTVIISGICVSGKTYFIEKTESNHFGSGNVAGNTFTSNGTEVADINNQVREVLSTYFFSDGANAIVKSFSDFRNWRAHLYYNKMDASSIDIGGYLRDSFRMSDLVVLNDSSFVSNATHRLLNTNYSFNQRTDFPLLGFSWDYVTNTQISLLKDVFGTIPQTYFVNYDGYLTNAKIVELSQDNQEVGFHTWWDESLGNYPPERKGFYETAVNYTEAQLIDYYTKGLAYYNNVLGYNLESKAYIGGQVDAQLLSVAPNYFKFKRGISATLTTDNVSKFPNSFLHLNSELLDVPKYTEMTGYIDTMIANGYSFMSIYGHPGNWDGTKYNATGVVDASGKTQLEWMADMLTYIRTKQNAGTEVRIVTLKQIYDIVNQLL